MTEPGQGLDHEGRAWKVGEDGQTWEKLFGGITSAERKRAFALRLNVESFTDHYAHHMCGFLTLTADGGDMGPKEFGRVWDDMRKRNLRWLRAYVRVIEAQKRGAPHYHLVCATPYDLAPSKFDFEALAAATEARRQGDDEKARELTRKYAQSAVPELRGIWSELRSVCRAYGLGRSEFLPFRKSAGAVAHYVGKYLEGGLNYKRADWKGVRRVEYDRKESKQWKACGSAFGWVSPGATAWRVRVGELAAALGASTPAELVEILGPRWAYHARPAIMQESDREWRRLMGDVAAIHGGTVARRTIFRQGSDILAYWPALGESDDLGKPMTIHDSL